MLRLEMSCSLYLVNCLQNSIRGAYWYHNKARTTLGNKFRFKKVIIIPHFKQKTTQCQTIFFAPRLLLSDFLNSIEDISEEHCDRSHFDSLCGQHQSHGTLSMAL